MEFIILKKQRDSNMELLRIIAMLLVMVVHANFRALPYPTVLEANSDVLSTILRFFTESISIISVNVFVLLSGWYGIKVKFIRLLELLFQIFFFSLLGFIIYCFLISNKNIGLNELSSLFMLQGTDYWFVKAYLGLYLLSPILNIFVEYATQKQYQVVLFSFYVFQTIYAWLSSGAAYFMGGYSAISFVGLYLLARYVRLYPQKIWLFPRKYDLLIYLLIVVATTIIVYFLRKYGLPYGERFYLYSSPLVIFSALHFLLFFTKISFYNKLINWISISCFSIYLLHSNSLLADPCYDDIVLEWFNNMDCIPFLLHVIVLIISIFIISILFDKVRIIIWRILSKMFVKFIDI